jgi:hypothetical protein
VWIGKIANSASILVANIVARENYFTGGFVGENSELLVRKLEDRVFLQQP